MKTWPAHPVIYEINTWTWLTDLSRTHGRPLDLGTVPVEEWDRIAAGGFDAVWFMGVWERSPAGIAVSRRNPALIADFQRVLLTSYRPTTSDRPTASAVTSSTRTWAARRASRPRAGC
jgi:hypothetical protein